MTKKRSKFLYSLESFNDLFCVVFLNTETKVHLFYQISEKNNMVEKLQKFLISGIQLIGYNSIGHDYQLLHEIVLADNNIGPGYIRKISKEILKGERAISNSSIFPQLDLYRINGYNSKKIPLSWLQFSYGRKVIRSIPVHKDYLLKNVDHPSIIDSCRENVDFLNEIYENSKPAIRKRMALSKELGNKVMNMSNSKIGELLIRTEFEKISAKTIKKGMKTSSVESIKLSEVIPDDIEYNHVELKKFVSRLSKLEIHPKDSLTTDIDLDGLVITFSKGGLHTNDVSGVIENTKGALEEHDVISMHSSTIVNESIAPRHLGRPWIKAVGKVKDMRMETIRKDPLKKEVFFKEALNAGSYGKLNYAPSWQYDPLASYKTTIIGELRMLELIDKLIAMDVEVISVNNDGLVLHYSDWDENLVADVIGAWESKNGYSTKKTTLKKIVYNGINNYIGFLTDGHLLKGQFAINKSKAKDNSRKIIPIALFEYFVNGKSIKETITNHKNILDFCVGLKAKGKVYWMSDEENPMKIEREVIRYFVSNDSVKIFEEDIRGNKIPLEKGLNITMFMEVIEDVDYNVNYNYYINECSKIIRSVEARRDDKNYKQEKLF